MNVSGAAHAQAWQGFIGTSRGALQPSLPLGRRYGNAFSSKKLIA